MATIQTAYSLIVSTFLFILQQYILAGKMVIARRMRVIAIVSLFLTLHIAFWPVNLAIAVNSTVSALEALGQNPNSSVKLNADGTPVGASGTYYPSEENLLLGKAVYLTPLECAQKYGEHFCACDRKEDGAYYCYYSRPAAGYYDSMASCEGVWGAGHCICEDANKCRLYDSADMGTALACMGQVYFFSGEKMECRKSGIMTMGENCCNTPSKESESCSFEKLSKEIGMDDLAMASMSLGMTFADMAGYSVTDMLSQKVAEVIVNSWVKDGSMSAISSSLVSLLGGEFQGTMGKIAAEQAMEQFAGQLGKEMAVEVVGNAITAVASAISSFISFVGWVYFAYQCYNMIQSMQECSAGELMLGCKVAKGVCHSVGSRCKVKVMGGCLQSMKVYCCFGTKLAKIIHEQGRPQIGRDWGSAKDPDCKGFLMDEFAQLDLSKVDFTEFADDLIREMNPNIAAKYQQAVDSLGTNFMNN